MALREDYYTPCVTEIERRRTLITTLVEDLTPANYDEEFGLENSKCSDEIETELKKIIDSLNKLDMALELEKRKLANDIADVGGWF